VAALQTTLFNQFGNIYILGRLLVCFCDLGLDLNLEIEFRIESCVF